MTVTEDPSTRMHVREPSPEEYPRLRAIQAASLPEPEPELLDPALAPATLVLVAGDPPVGYAVVVPGETEAYLAELAVAPDHRRQGHGTALVEAATDRLDATALTLAVRRDDERARSFYRERGFTVRRPLPDHFEGGEGLLLARDC